jgi:hypothetical protein
MTGDVGGGSWTPPRARGNGYFQSGNILKIISLYNFLVKKGGITI